MVKNPGRTTRKVHFEVDLWRQDPQIFSYVDNPAYHFGRFFKPRIREVGLILKGKVNSYENLPGKEQTYRLKNEGAAFMFYNWQRFSLENLMREREEHHPRRFGRLAHGLIREIRDSEGKIFSGNCGLVFQMYGLLKKRKHIVDRSDAISDGNLALLDCIQGFDQLRGFTFATYACRGILQRMARVGSKMKTRSDRMPTSTMHTEDGGTLALDENDEFNHDSEARNPIPDVARIQELMKGTLSSRELDIMQRRFGLMNRVTGERGEGETLGVIAKRYRITRERVRQVQLKAMKKLRSLPELQMEWLR